jgi:GT2 family glycosyltransferase
METGTHQYRVGAVTVTYGSRLALLEQTVEAVLKDVHVTNLVVVDNASSEKEGIEELVKKHAGRVRVVRHENNVGSAGGFAAGLRMMREEEVDYVYLSDDDVVISGNFVESFMRAHQVIGNDKAVLLSRRASFWAGTDVHYRPETDPRPRKYFNIVSPHILKVFLKSLLGIKDGHPTREMARFFPIIPSRGWAYAGVLLPIEAVRKAPLPDETLGLYLDDIVYSWGVIDAGFPSFALIEPHLEDLEMTHSGSHTSTGLFSPHVSSTKIYYETRNRVRVSLKYGKADKTLLALQVFIWYVAVCFLGLVRNGMQKSALRRMRLIGEALLAGFDTRREIPQGIAVRI